jgi:3'-5' exoribonuclease 1
MNYIVLDLEATDSKEIIEIGAVKLNEELQIVSEFSSFVKPTINSTLSHYIKKLTNITQDEVNAAQTFPKVLEVFEKWVGEDATFITWSKSDKYFFRSEFITHGIHNDTLSKFVNIQNIVCSFASPDGLRSLENALSLLGMEFEGEAHRAFTDAFNTSKLFVEAIKRLGGFNELLKIEQHNEQHAKPNSDYTKTIPNKFVSQERYRRHLELLTIEELEKKKMMLSPLVNESENTIQVSYLSSISWQKYKLVDDVLAYKKKVLSLSKEGLKFEHLEALLECSISIFYLKENILTKKTKAASEELTNLQKRILINKKQASKLHSLKNLRVTKKKVIYLFADHLKIIDESLNSIFFRNKYEKKLIILKNTINLHLEELTNDSVLKEN